MHAWYVFPFIYPVYQNTLRTYFRTLHDGLERYTLSENITKIRVKAVRNYNDITESYEDLYSTLHYDIWEYNGTTGMSINVFVAHSHFSREFSALQYLENNKPE